jgi:PKD repeat protein
VGINAGAMMNTFGVESYQWTEGALNNGGEEIEFRDAYGVVQDYVMFDDEAPWPPEADGAGPSLTLCNPDDDNSLPESWIASTEFAAINQEGDTLWATPLTGCSNIPPVADFIASQTMINVGGAVDFTDLSIGYPDNWSWTFEGGTPETSSEQHPEGILYMNPGTYMVSLTVSNAMGTDTKTVDDYITAGYPPEADFEASATQITVGETVTFTDLTTQDPHTWEWTFQGGIPGTSTEQNPAVFYEMAGDFDVILVATNDFGQSTMHKPLYIHVSVGVSEFREAGLIKAYPNPGDGRLTIEHQSGRIEAEIMDLVGKKVWQYTGDQAVITSDLSEAPRGIYILRVVFVESGEIFTQKLILQ